MTPLKTDLRLEQEYNNMAETTINPLTGLPMGGQPTVADSEEGAVKINPLTNEAMTSPAPTVTLGGSPSYTNQMMFRTDYRGNRDLSKFDKASISGSDYNVAKGQLLDWEEIRARNQTTADKWGNGLAKAGVTAVGAVAENTLGIMFGLGELASGGAYYDNAIGNKIDETNEWMRENMPNYLTQREEQMNTFQKLGTANFWADTVAGGLGYSVGSIATMYLTGGMGPIGALSKLGGAGSTTSALYNAAKAVTNGTKLASSLAKGANIGNNILKAAKVAEVGIMMSLAEGSVEARETQKTVFEDLTQEYLQENNLKNLGDIPAAELKKMEDASYAAGNRNFVTQLPVLAGTNLLMFGKQAMGFRGAVKEAGETTFDIASKKAVSNYANDGFWKSTLKKLKPMGANGIEESFQEGAQYFSGQFASKYHSDKYKNNGYADMSEALSHALSETFGTQEGFESMFVGFLTGALMGGGRSVVSGEYSQRKAAADKLASFQNAGYFDRANAKAQSANAGSESLKRLKGFQDRGDHKGFKDEQHNLIAINTLQSLEMGGYDVKMEMLEDAKNLSDEEFMKAFGYPGQDAQGNALTLEQQTNGKSKAQVVEGLKAKMEQVKKIYENVSNRFELAPKSSGLVRKMMSTEERLAEDVVYEERLNLRNELVLRGSRVENNVFRMKNIQQDMNDTINNSLGRGLGPGSLAENYISEALGDFSMFETDPGEMDAEKYSPKEQFNAMRDKLAKAVNTVAKTDVTAAETLAGQVRDYMAIAEDTIQGLGIYNKLASDPFAQASLQREIEAGQEATRIAEQDKAFNEGLGKAQSSEDVNSLGKEFKDLTPAQKAAGNKKYKELKAKEDAQQKKFELVEGTLEERIQKLDDMDKTKMTPIEVAGLNKAIKSLKELKRRQDAGEIEVVPGEISEDQTGQHKGVNEVEDTFKEAETELRVVPVSDNGREFMIDGKLYTNKRTNPLDAIVRKERSGEIIKVDLVDEDGNRVPFWGPEALVDALAFHIMMSEAYKMEGQPTIEKQETLDKQTAIDNKREKIATKGKHGVKTSELLRREMYEHQMLLEEALDNYDDLRTSYMQEAGATAKEAAADPELKEMKKGINKLNTAIRNRRNVLKARGEFLGPTSEELIVIEGKATDRINENEELLTVVQNQIADLESDVEFSQKAIDDYMAKAYDANGRPLPVSDPASLAAAKDDNNKATQKLDQRRQEEIALKNLIDLDKKELKRLQNEKDNRLPGDAEQTGASPAAETKEQVDEGEDTNNRESAEEEGADVEAQQADIERRRKESLIPNPAYEEGYVGNRFWVYTGPNGQQSEQLSTTENLESDINAAYDAELSALGQEQPVIVENRGTDDVRVQKAVQDKKAEDKILEDEGGTVIAEFDLINETIMPPVDTSAPTLGESLAAAAKPAQQTPAMVGDLGIDAASDDKVIMHEGRSKIPVASTGEVDVQVDTLNGDPILLNKDMLVTGNGKSIVGTTVEFEVIENDFYKETYGDTLNEANIPIYYKIGGKIVGKLQASDNANRAELVKRLKSGEKVTSTISSVVAGNVNNARTTDGQSYFRNPNNVFGNGQVVLGTVKSLEGTRFFTAGTMSDPSTQEIIEEGLMAKSPEGAATGGVAIIIRPENHPAGEVGVSMASTAGLTDGAKAAVVNALRDGNFDLAKEIVAHSVGESRFDNQFSTDYLEFGQFGNDGAEYMVYNSPAGEGLVRINKAELVKALRNEPFKLNFVEVKGDNKLATVKNTDAKYDSVKDNFIKDFNTFLNGKKYQVDNNRVNLDGAYTSPVTGNDYSSYQEYLFSDKEGVNRMPGYGHQSIVATDVVNTSSGLHHNVQVKFSLGDLNGDTAADVMKITNFAKRSRRGGGARARLASPYAQDKKSPNLNEGCK